MTRGLAYVQFLHLAASESHLVLVLNRVRLLVFLGGKGVEHRLVVAWLVKL